ncbi:alpha-N-acetylneuraminide alpha-2,8-sialyltransferase-like [Leptodactylus fuscus]|uniref:alpha-N-acetylneuraminide alpha-2,8-sialyltransferase-like n=1 Tax=Leptodactylus fuscus TaxID=238119 RepID=UPI003F4EF573
MARRRHLVLILVLVLTCFIFYQNLQHQVGNSHRLRRTHKNLPEAECQRLKSVILNSIRKKWTSSNFVAVAKSLQGCPWEANHTARDLKKSQFIQCCNASHTLLLTQENSPVGNHIIYDADNTIRNVTESLHDLYPKMSPFTKPIRHCAVVGNGGILRNSSCGEDIDKADFVFRLNFPPLNWTEDIGTKTHLVTANPSILRDKYNSLMNYRKPFINMVKAYSSAMVLLPAFSYKQNTDISLRTLYTLEDFGLKSRVVFFNPDYLRNLSAYWKRLGLKFRRMSSGLMLASAAFEVCEKVSLYGFWPFSQDFEGSPILHHYYDDKTPKPGFHSMSDEFYQYLRMHSEGALELRLHC